MWLIRQSVTWANKSHALLPNYCDLYTGSKNTYIITVYMHTFLVARPDSECCLFWNSRLAKRLSLTCLSL